MNPRQFFQKLKATQCLSLSRLGAIAIRLDTNLYPFILFHLHFSYAAQRSNVCHFFFGACRSLDPSPSALDLKWQGLQPAHEPRHEPRLVSVTPSLHVLNVCSEAIADPSHSWHQSLLAATLDATRNKGHRY